MVVNLGPSDAEIFFVQSAAGAEEELIPQGVVEGGGGSLDISTYDGHVLEIRSGETPSRVTVRRSNGHPQLLPVGAAQHDELCEFL